MSSHIRTPTGWLGPEVGTTKPRYLWGRYPFFFGAIQMTEFDPSLTTSVVNALYKFVTLANSMLRSNNTGVEEWTATRWEDFVITLQWLFDNHPNTTASQALLIDTMERLKFTGVPLGEVLPYHRCGTHSQPIQSPVDRSGTASTWLKVSKHSPATFRFTHNQSDLDTASLGWDLLFQYHGRPSGIYAADEYLAGLEATRGTELCLVVETMFSGSYLYQIIGDPKFPDRVERIAYNALPATLTGNMWNRTIPPAAEPDLSLGTCRLTRSPWTVPTRTFSASSRTTLAVPSNHPQGWPKFITNAFVTTPDMSSLVHVYLGPFSTSVTLVNGNTVTANVATLYPFSDTLTTTITAKAAFTYQVRIPSWVVNGTIAINGAAAKALAPVNGLQAVTVAAGTTTFVLNLPAAITTEVRPHGAIAVHRGPLNFAFDIPRKSKVLATNADQPMAQDFEFDATANWQYAIDPSTLAFSLVPACFPAFSDL
ncbi:hypothetical protein C8F01DRAFT_1276822 [Mycena amicta]|nr:hypothetical protein C8F01DRAFT_1276822 [Mycena amicta]